MTAPGSTGWLSDRFELSRGGEISNLRPMEGLRGFAVLLVFLVHFHSLSMPWQIAGSTSGQLLHAAHNIGNVGVDLFFVLSGFLIYGTLIERAQPFLRYLRRRARRIYPTFLVVLALYLGLSLVLPQHSKLPNGAAATAVYVLQNILLLPGMLPIRPIVEVAWSLSYEMFFYLVMPLLIVLANLRARTRVWRFGFFVVLWSIGLALAALWGGPVRLSGFLAGVLLYELNRIWPDLRPTSPWAVTALVVVAGVMVTPMPGAPLQALRMLVLGLAFALLCLVCFAQPRAVATRLFSWLPLRWLGNMSYSYYLIHGLALHGFFTVLARLPPTAGDGLPVLALLLPAFACTLLVSAILFLTCERPMSLQPRTPQPRSSPGRATQG